MMVNKNNIDIIPKNSSLDMKKKYHNDFRWILYGRRIQRNPFIKKFLLNKYNNKCLWCGKNIRSTFVIHHIDYDNMCILNEIIAMPYETKYGKQTVRNIPNCEKCYKEMNENFNNCINKLVPVHQMCNKLIYDYMSENAEYNFEILDEMDLPIILNISKEIFLINYINILDKNIVENFINSKQYVKEIVKNIENCILIKYENKIIGFTTIYKNQIKLIMIGEKYQKHKVCFLKYLESKLFEEYSVLNLESIKEDTIANMFYEENGWIKDRESDMNSIILNIYKKSKNI